MLLLFFVVILTILITDRARFKQVNYALLATFFVFFIFSGNIARVPVIKDFIASIVERNTLIAGITGKSYNIKRVFKTST